MFHLNKPTALLILVFLVVAQVRAAGFETVAVESGRLSGGVEGEVVFFKGVPFAAPPSGDLRWRPPQPPKPWQGTLTADHYGHDCMQLPFAEDMAPLRTTPSEDCLVLNVWRPANARRDLPVMVWIYGGGLVNGGTSPAVYDGSAFARQDIVFISINYRLGRFGFFAHPALRADRPQEPLGNYGYLDQIAALKWINRNVAAFGGDPKRVTVFGESAGGWSVHMLMTSPMARGLFTQAMVQSGGGRSGSLPLRHMTQGSPGDPSAEEAGLQFARSARIEQGEGASKALRALNAGRIIAGLNLASMFRGPPPDYSGPMLDGQVLPENPSAAYAGGRQARVPVVVGANDADIGSVAGNSVEEIFAGIGADPTEAARAYGAGPDPKRLAAQVGMDRVMVEPARFVARSVAAQGAPVYEFRFEYVAKSRRGQWTAGAVHASEIPYVFDTVKAAYGKDLAAEDAAVAKTVNRYWATFVKSGSPNGEGLTEWPRYDPARDILMRFGADGQARAMPDSRRARLDVVEQAALHPARP